MKTIGLAVGLGLVVALGAGPAFAQYTGGGNISLPKTDTMDPSLLYKQGVEYIQAKDYTRAVAVLRDVLQKRESDPAANLMMGVAQIGLNDLNEAKKYLSRAVSEKPDLADAVGRLGWVEAKLGNAAGAKAQRDALTKLKDKCAGKCPEAATISAAFATLDGVAAAAKPTVSAAARFNQGVDALNAKKFAEADAAFGDVLAQKSDDWEAAYMRGQAQAALNNHAGAKASFEAAIKLQPGLVDGKARLAVAEKKLGNVDAAGAIRAQLQASSDKCAGTCAGAKAIADAITMVDAAK
jgi:tetratricopeptide (TPR) repeat protein